MIRERTRGDRSRGALHGRGAVRRAGRSPRNTAPSAPAATPTSAAWKARGCCSTTSRIRTRLDNLVAKPEYAALREELDAALAGRAEEDRRRFPARASLHRGMGLPDRPARQRSVQHQGDQAADAPAQTAAQPAVERPHVFEHVSAKRNRTLSAAALRFGFSNP